ncbi:MAG: hypothetical protein ABIZ70_00145, partial [Gemmatimonadales bacterium]
LLAPTGSSTDSLLHANAIVRIRVPTMKATWFGGRVVRSTSAGGCLAVMLEMTNPEERQRFVFLSGVDSLRVDRRTNTGVMALQLGPAAEDDWQAFSPAELAEANAGCRGTRRPAARPRPAKSR